MTAPMHPLVADLVTGLNADQLENFHERAGIFEFEANVPRGEAEALALLDLLQRRTLDGHWLFKAADFQGTRRCILTSNRALAIQPLEITAVLNEEFNGNALLSPL